MAAPLVLVFLLLLAACGGGGEAPARTVGTAGAGGGLQQYEAADPATDKSHVADPEYPSAPKPPVRGAHNGSWLRCEVYTEPVADGMAVHSLEHGAVWVTYEPGLPKERLDNLVALRTLNKKYVLVSPYPGQGGRIKATAWGLQLTVDDSSDSRLDDFVRKYAGGDQGGEPGVSC